MQTRHAVRHQRLSSRQLNTPILELNKEKSCDNYGLPINYLSFENYGIPININNEYYGIPIVLWCTTFAEVYFAAVLPGAGGSAEALGSVNLLR